MAGHSEFACNIQQTKKTRWAKLKAKTINARQSLDISNLRNEICFLDHQKLKEQFPAAKAGILKGQSGEKPESKNKKSVHFKFSSSDLRAKYTPRFSAWSVNAAYSELIVNKQWFCQHNNVFAMLCHAVSCCLCISLNVRVSLLKLFSVLSAQRNWIRKNKFAIKNKI